jgi:hypothetical protein
MILAFEMIFTPAFRVSDDQIGSFRVPRPPSYATGFTETLMTRASQPGSARRSLKRFHDLGYPEAITRADETYFEVFRSVAEVDDLKTIFKLWKERYRVMTEDDLP